MELFILHLDGESDGESGVGDGEEMGGIGEDGSSLGEADEVDRGN